MDQYVPDKLVMNPIRRNLYSGKLYSLQLYIPPIETIYSPKYYQVSSFAILYLALPWKASTDGVSQVNDRSFAIRPNNYRSVLRVFDRALRWFEDEAFSDLYLTVDDHLIFNSKYNDICVKYTPNYMETQALKIAPICIEYAMGKYQEGVRIYLNRFENFMELTVDQLRELFDLLMGFNFPQEVSQTLMALWHSQMTKSIVEQENYRNRMLQSN